MEESLTKERNEKKCKQDKGFFIQKEILCECKFKSILALCVAKEWEGTLYSVQNVSTGYTRGVLEFMEV